MFRITTITHLIFLSSSFQVSAFDTIKSFDGLYLESSLRLKPPILKEGHTWKSSKSFWVNRYRSGPKVVSFGKYFSGDYKVHLRLNAAYDYIKSQPTNFKVQFKTYLFRKQQYLQRFLHLELSYRYWKDLSLQNIFPLKLSSEKCGPTVWEISILPYSQWPGYWVIYIAMHFNNRPF